VERHAEPRHGGDGSSTSGRPSTDHEYGRIGWKPSLRVPYSLLRFSRLLADMPRLFQK
jgi:hypothetical protein